MPVVQFAIPHGAGCRAIVLEQIEMDFDAVQRRLEPRSFVFKLAAARSGNAASRCSMQPQPVRRRRACRKEVDSVSLTADTLSLTIQRKRNDKRWESMSVAAARPRNQHPLRDGCRRTFTLNGA